MPEIHYRQVPFGTSLISPPGGGELRGTVSRENESILFANELAVDVGGICFGIDSETRLVFDHHFSTSPHPSAAAAVLMSLSQPDFASALERLRQQESVWLVAHNEPDFDAESARFLLRCALDGSLPLEPFQALSADKQRKLIPAISRAAAYASPSHQGLPVEVHWAFYLALYASFVDQSRSLPVPRHRSLHGMLYAGSKRGSDFGEGSYDFFRKVRRILQADHWNPLIDNIFGNEGDFAPELAFLERQEEFYARDLKRAERCLLRLPCEPFAEWYPQVATQPLYLPDGSLNPVHARAGCGRYEVFDAIFLRDPDCALFKEYARQDLENSALGRGFTFAAIVYSHAITSPKLRGQYFFSLDPERARGAHLWPLWARLQERWEKGRTIEDLQPVKRNAGARFCDWSPCPDPWFPGSNFQATIVVSPASGSIHKEGNACNLRDDEAANEVRHLFGTNFFSKKEYAVWDYRIDPSGDASSQAESPGAGSIKMSLESANTDHLAEGFLRFACIPLRDDCDLALPSLRQQLGREIWHIIEDGKIDTVPDDFEERHLLGDLQNLVVWNRRGLAIAYKGTENASQASAAGFAKGADNCPVEEMRAILCEVAEILRRIRGMVGGTLGSDRAANQAQELFQKFLSLKLRAAPSGRTALRRILEAWDFDHLLEGLNALNREKAAQREERGDRFLAVLATVFIVPSLVLAFFDAADSFVLKDAVGFVQEELGTKKWTEIDFSQHWGGVLLFTLLGTGLGIALTRFIQWWVRRSLK